MRNVSVMLCAYNSEFPFSFIPFFIFYISLGKWGIKEGRRRAGAPSLSKQQLREQ